MENQMDAWSGGKTTCMLFSQLDLVSAAVNHPELTSSSGNKEF